MKYLFLYFSLTSYIFASFDNLTTFQANFIQTITDEKNKILIYSGSVLASKPQNVLWHYKEPVDKLVYINAYSVSIVEPEIEQVIIKNLDTNFDFFNMIKNAKKIALDIYFVKFKNVEFYIKTKDNLLYSISYIDEFENAVKIIFSNQLYNQEISEKRYIPSFDLDFDVIRD